MTTPVRPPVRHRFNPPPGWPAPPAGWLPGPGWVPDPAWPPPPEGWRFIVPQPSPGEPMALGVAITATLAVAVVGFLFGPDFPLPARIVVYGALAALVAIAFLPRWAGRRRYLVSGLAIGVPVSLGALFVSALAFV